MKIFADATQDEIDKLGEPILAVGMRILPKGVVVRIFNNWVVVPM